MVAWVATWVKGIFLHETRSHCSFRSLLHILTANGPIVPHLLALMLHGLHPNLITVRIYNSKWPGTRLTENSGYGRVWKCLSFIAARTDDQDY